MPLVSEASSTKGSNSLATGGNRRQQGNDRRSRAEGRRRFERTTTGGELKRRDVSPQLKTCRVKEGEDGTDGTGKERGS